MVDKGADVLEKYDFEVTEISRGRGFYIVYTDKGPRILREYRGSGRHIEWMSGILDNINEGHELLVDSYIRNKEGEYITEGEYGQKYIVKRWYECRECDNKNYGDTLGAIKALGTLHCCLSKLETDQMSYIAKDIDDEMKRHNSEIIRIKKYINRKHPKSNFEILAGNYCDMFYSEGKDAYDMMTSLEIDRCKTMGFTHGDYNYHNVSFSQHLPIIMNFEKMSINFYMMDLYHFMRKIMEKYDWDIKLGYKMISEYDKERCISTSEIELLGILFSYPEKFWKIINGYYNSNKAWIPAKNYDKLQKIIMQNDKRIAFINTVH